MTDSLSDSLDLAHADDAWEKLADHVDSFIDAWGKGEPPPLSDFVPAGPPALRRMALVELIKIDLERRAERRCLKSLGEYFADFPELGAGDAPPLDLIYEDFHIRRQTGDTVVAADYFQRFPQHASRLQRLLGIDVPYQCTQVARCREPLAACAAGSQIDDFELIVELGAGAFARVFLARQRSMQRRVALKISQETSDEPQTLAQLDHPHIVRVYDQRVLADQQLRLLYMQYLPGGTLENIIDHVHRLKPAERTGQALLEAVDASLYRRGETPPADSLTRRMLAQMHWGEAVCWIGARLAEALHYAHQRGILHRDIKPANVLLSAEALPKLADFNISYASGLEGTSPRAFFGGSLAYMSPEQLEAYDPNHPRQPDDLDGRSDLYSLGIVLFEMLAGERPFFDIVDPNGMDATVAEMAGRRRSGVPAEVFRKLPDDTPRGLCEVTEKCLQPAVEDRYADAGELARDLDLCLLPQVQELLRPDKRSWRRKVARRPAFWIMVVALLPNFLMSGLNILFNRLHGAQEVPSSTWGLQLAVVNAVAYSLGIGLCFVATLPVFRAGVELRAAGKLASESQKDAGRRALRLGYWLAGISLVLWLATAIVFPIWIEAATGDSDIGRYGLFMASGALCGLIASSLTFFVTTYLLVRAIYPALFSTAADDGSHLAAINRLSRRLMWFFAALVITPLVSVLVLAVHNWQKPWVFGGLAVLGAGSFAVSFWLGRQIQADLAALRMAVSPEVGNLATSGGAMWATASRSRLEDSRGAGLP
ncbi:MAG: serine/threonine protein kinase [Planctomycetia bacterium]|nr:serine/threonine protein kinase [Planctomycetia bacterium]